jgi:hypothetical protein
MLGFALAAFASPNAFTSYGAVQGGVLVFRNAGSHSLYLSERDGGIAVSERQASSPISTTSGPHSRILVAHVASKVACKLTPRPALDHGPDEPP